jgi:penicillin-binding protein 2
MTQRRSDSPQLPTILLRLGILGVAALLIGRLWQLQLIEGEQYRILADRNRFRQVDVAAPRGVIYDHNGEILARNEPSFSVVIIPADLPEPPDGSDETPGNEVLDRLLGLLARPDPRPGPLPSSGPTPTATAAPKADQQAAAPASPFVIREREPWVMTRAEIEKAVEDGLIGGAYRPVTIARHIKDYTAFAIAEDAVNLPGIQLVLEPIREYPSGALTAHIIGYMGHIPEGQLEDYESNQYGRDEQVGLTGLELSREKELRGSPGRQTIEVDVNGRRVRTVGEAAAAVPGYNLHLSLDMKLQRVATQALQEALDNSEGFTKATQGTVVAIDPRSGAVRALVSLPNYDNNLFAKGITDEAWQALTTDPDLPLFNRSVGGQYPPGSVFKILVASGALQEGVISQRTQLGDGFDGRNDGIIWLPNEYYPWDRTKDQPFYSWIHKYGYGHGLVGVRDAIAISDDIFFYQLGGGYREFRGLGPTAIGKYAKEFGLGQTSGIELTGEGAGLVPTPKWKRINWAENWLTGDTYNMSIGQGYVLVTPLQMAAATSAVANHGFLYRPQLVERLTDADGNTVGTLEPDLIREVAVDPTNLDTVREGMYGAINWRQGTATRVKVPGVVIAGKTGTAEFFRDDNKDLQPDRDDKGNLPTHAWFTSFAPYVDPEIVVTVFVANGGEGSAVAAPIAQKILEAYFLGDQEVTPDAPPVPADPAAPAQAITTTAALLPGTTRP